MQPNDDVATLPSGVQLALTPAGQYSPSKQLIILLLLARNGYDWPAGTGAGLSQRTILNLISQVSVYLANLTPASAHAIVVDVSLWAGNNANSHSQIAGATSAQKSAMHQAISLLVTPGQESNGIDALCALPGISLVIASKIFRFCSPMKGVAVDRHASYFFNSLQVVGGNTATNFVREWANGRHTTSRLAIYNNHNYAANKNVYFTSYLPILSCISREMNASAVLYTCAASSTSKQWTPADVEMAAYYWWATHGPR